MAIHIGCGSWADAKYVRLLYPKGSPANQRLHLYAQWFDRIELNNTYHNTPTPYQVAEWTAQTPADFIFDFKLHRSFSQSPARAAASDEVEKLHAAVQPLLDAKKLGAFLLTLPPSFDPERHRLDELDALIGKLPLRPLAVELRHRDWVKGDTLDATLAYFRRHKLVWVAVDLPQLDSPNLLPPIDQVTNSHLAYLRLHGRNPDYLKAETAAEKHHYDYTERDLEEIVGRIQTLAAHAKDVHVSVNNHAENFAPKAALTLRRLLGQRVKGVNLESQDTLFGD
jgi:uncharacterized protein YecE (DUF72 family)